MSESKESGFDKYVRELMPEPSAGKTSSERVVSTTTDTAVSTDTSTQDPRFIGGLLAGLGSVVSSPAGQAVIAQLPGLLSSIFGGQRELRELEESSSDIVQQDPRFIGGLLAGLGSVIGSPIGQQVIAQVPSLLGGLFRRRRELEVAVQQDPRFLSGVLECIPALSKLPGGKKIVGQGMLGGCFGGGRKDETTPYRPPTVIA
jgi:hypothetical protein